MVEEREKDMVEEREKDMVEACFRKIFSIESARKRKQCYQ
jgi:hypothetical protein